MHRERDSGVSGVHELFENMTPREATLALLKYDEYIALVEKAGVEMTEELCRTIMQELRSVCINDTLPY